METEDVILKECKHNYKQVHCVAIESRNPPISNIDVEIDSPELNSMRRAIAIRILISL